MWPRPFRHSFDWRRRRTAALLCGVAWLIGAGIAEARRPWVVLNNCRLMRSESLDADSFHVKANGKEYIFRLYFVDAPETDMSFADRVDEQAKYFRLKPEQTITLGEHARRFTKEKLNQPFTVRTCMQDALGRSKLDRYYAFVETTEGDLAGLLVANGLARVHGAAAQPAGLRSPQREWARLKRLEREAKQLKVGAWGAPTGRMTARTPKPQAKSGPNSFDAFFHPERLAVAAESAQDSEDAASFEPTPSPTPTLSALVTPLRNTAALAATSAPQAAPPAPSAGASRSVAAAEARLDVNRATPAELQAISGIGPVLAQRIIEARPYQTADELLKVKGIGPKKYEQIRSKFR